MKLPGPLASILEKKPKTEYLLALLLRDEKISAVIIEETEGKIKIVGKGEELLPLPLEQTPVDSWTQILDRIISRAEEALPANAETSKTVFGVKENWVEEKKIKKDYLTKLKSVCDGLSLSPIGFLVISEAIAHLIQEEEGAPLNAILTEVGTKQLTVTLFRSGKILEVKQGEIQESVPKTVDFLLKHFTSVEVLPTRLIIFDGDRGEALAQEFIAFQWSKGLPFLHMPQVSLLPFGFDGKAVVYGAATQMGLEIVGSIIDKTAQDIKNYAQNTETSSPPQEGQTPPSPDTATPLESPSVSSNLPTPLTTVPSDNFGFVENQDIALTQKSSEQPVIATETPATPPLETSPSISSDQGYANEDQETSEKPHPLQKIKDFFASMPAFPEFSLGRFGGMRNKKLIIIPILLLIIILSIIGAYLYFLSATITLDAKAKQVEENKEISFSLDSSNDFASDVIAAKSITTTLTGTVSTTTTGKKEVGEKAKGNVTLYNSAEAKRQLPAGTTLTASNGLIFVTDKDVIIASASGDIFSGIKSGTTTVAVTAEKMGTEYNLPSNAKFSVGTISTLAAKNDSAFSGGSKKTVQVVAKKDREKLLADLPKSLQEKAHQDLTKKVASGDVVLPVTFDATLDEKDFDKKENDEAKKVSLTAAVSFSSAVYKKEDLLNYAKERLADQATNEQTISDKGIENDLKDIKKSDDQVVTANLAVKASLLPKIDKASLSQQLSGKSFTDAEAILKKEPQIEQVTITTRPMLPFLPKILPVRKEQITIQLTFHD